ncbi:MAG: hypothetical protein WC969_08050 [Elusimicrobiota bacterium]|jgi:hypothetical protein
MKRKLAMAAMIPLLAASTCWAVRGYLFTDLDTYIKHGKQIVLAEALESGNPDKHEDGLYVAKVKVSKVLAGKTRLGKLQIYTIYPLSRGELYLLYSSSDPPDFQSTSELSVVSVPNGFDVKRLNGKSLKQQLVVIFEASRSQMSRDLRMGQKQYELLGKAIAP